MGIDDSRTPIVTAPVDLILSRVGLAANEGKERDNPIANTNPKQTGIILQIFIAGLLDEFDY
jgi:hypothetical protein